MLAAAIGNCLAASLLFCLQRRGVKAAGVHANVHMELVRNERKRLRVGRVAVKLNKGTSEIPEDKLRACLDSFEDFCVVTQSVRDGIAVEVTVE
jgi:organic hydroperoxide reductase OsmC/OhrA